MYVSCLPRSALFLISGIFPAKKSNTSFHIKRRTEMVFRNGETLSLERGKCLNIFVNKNPDSGSAGIRHMLVDMEWNGVVDVK